MPNNPTGEKVLVPKWVTSLLIILNHISRAEEALRCVEENSVELDMEQLFSHLKETMQEHDELAQALSLSLGNYEIPKENGNEKGRYVSYEENVQIQQDDEAQ